MRNAHADHGASREEVAARVAQGGPYRPERSGQARRDEARAASGGMVMVNYARQLERMARVADVDGEGLGKYVAREFELSMLSGINKQTKAMLRQRLPHLARAVERCCHVAMQMTKQGLSTDYGLTLRSGQIFICRREWSPPVQSRCEDARRADLA